MGLIARKRERIAAQEKQELLDKQNKIGDDVYLAMKEAGDKNREYNKFSDGKINENLGPVMVGKIKSNGKNYSIGAGVQTRKVAPWSNFIGTERGSIVIGYPIIQANVNLRAEEGKELYYVKGPYGPDGYMSLDNLENFKEVVGDIVSTFKLYV